MSDSEFLTPTDYERVLHSQDACNLSGIVFEFSRAMKKICNEANRDGRGTEWKNTHPISRLYAEQIMHLTSAKDWNEAYNECKKNSGGA